MEKRCYKNISEGLLRLDTKTLAIGDYVVENEEGLQLDLAVLFSYFKYEKNYKKYLSWKDAEEEYRAMQNTFNGVEYKEEYRPNEFETYLVKRINRLDFTKSKSHYIFQPKQVLDEIDMRWVEQNLTNNVIIDVKYEEGVVEVTKRV